ncbi:RskA family anti-sigma factor [Nocardia alba]|uniref:Anti-sigma-K factor RskA N-terminal domain-containing protein n=1 Tax=Nocardia alba TaxID=225051 RepID=A0A4R1F7H6_9NOCA|nr:hypothetical protein [Nocardia alba]TCJ89550.1 hypothetical protein DFR71_6459 [Nocardia alba]
MSGQRGPQPPPGSRGGGARVPPIRSGADDREEMRALYHATGAAAFGLALRVLHRRGAAEDVVREGYRRARSAQWIAAEDDADREPDSPTTESGEDAMTAPLPLPGPDLGTPWGRSAFVATEQRSDLTPDYGAMDIAFGRGIVYSPDGSRPLDRVDDSSSRASDHLVDCSVSGRESADPRDRRPHSDHACEAAGQDGVGTDQVGADLRSFGPAEVDRPGAAYPGIDFEHLGRDHADAPGRDSPAFTADQSWLLAQIHRLAVQRLRLDLRGDDMPWLAAAARLGFEDPLDSHCEIFVLAYYGGRTYRAIGRELGMRVPMVTRLLAEGIERLAEQRIPRWTAKQPWSPPGSVLSLADAYALDAVAELEHHHIENKLAATTPDSLSQFATRVRGVHDVLALLAADDQHTPPRALETRILADLGTAPQRRGHWTAKPPWLRRFGGQPEG